MQKLHDAAHKLDQAHHTMEFLAEQIRALGMTTVADMIEREAVQVSKAAGEIDAFIRQMRREQTVTLEEMAARFESRADNYGDRHPAGEVLTVMAECYREASEGIDPDDWKTRPINPEQEEEI